MAPCKPHTWIPPEPEDDRLTCSVCNHTTMWTYDPTRRFKVRAILASVRKRQPEHYGAFVSYFITPPPIQTPLATVHCQAHGAFTCYEWHCMECGGTNPTLGKVCSDACAVNAEMRIVDMADPFVGL